MLTPLVGLFLLPLVLHQDPATLADRDPLAVPVIRYQAPVHLDDGSTGAEETLLSWEDYAAWLLRQRGRARAVPFGVVVAVERLAARRGVEVSDEEVERILDEEIAHRIEHAFGGDESAWRAEVASLGRTVGGVRRERSTMLHLDLLAERILTLDWVVGPEEVKIEWERTFGPNGHSIEVRGLQLRIDPPTTEDRLTREEAKELREARRQELLAEARTLRAEALAGTPFETLVALRSDDEPSKESGGRMPGIVLRKAWPQGVVDELVTLTPGEITRPFESRGGIWLLQVVSTKTTPLADVAAQLERALVERGPGTERTNAFLESLERTSTIDFPLADVNADPVGMLTKGSIVVNGEPVPLLNFARWIMHVEGETYGPECAGRRCVEALATANGLSVDQDELDARIDRELVFTLELGFKGRKEDWLKRLAQIGSNEAGWRLDVGRELRIDILVEKLLSKDRVVTRDDARNLYLQRYGTEGEKIDARYVVFDLGIEPQRDDETPREWKQRLAEAARPLLPLFAELQERFDDGEDFGALARRYSQDPVSAKNGGRPLGGFDERSLPDDVRDALRRQPVGVLGEPLPIGSKAYMFEVTARVKVEFDEIVDDLVEEIESKPPDPIRVATFFNDLTSRARPTPLPGMWR
ncbi:Foldase protein PrsA 3 precursor [Planctomycetes bacterium Pla163]|uniref:peptidylprolyl isomerase n=1 Tax=Rohdeia mirabilis TaxID=2528008 RepID=A0A518D322_9BACT|nr:Foldase protein PrsA 3 precursor [Planctomycetes bacterium Pla163]